jgi:hypothetical protein
MRAARFPVVQPVGTFTWEGLETPIELFSVQPISSPQLPLRVFLQPLRKIKMVGLAEGLAVIQPPVGRERALQNEPGFTWVDAPTVRVPLSFVAFEVKNAASHLSDSVSVALLREKLEICAAQVATRTQRTWRSFSPLRPWTEFFVYHELHCSSLHVLIYA